MFHTYCLFFCFALIALTLSIGANPRFPKRYNKNKLQVFENEEDGERPSSPNKTREDSRRNRRSLQGDDDEEEPDCSVFTCGAECYLARDKNCAWSTDLMECVYGETEATSSNEFDLGDCVICGIAVCGRDCRDWARYGCSWRKDVGCVLNPTGATLDSELNDGQCDDDGSDNEGGGGGGSIFDGLPLYSVISIIVGCSIVGLAILRIAFAYWKDHRYGGGVLPNFVASNLDLLPMPEIPLATQPEIATAVMVENPAEALPVEDEANKPDPENEV